MEIRRNSKEKGEEGDESMIELWKDKDWEAMVDLG